MPQPLFLRVLDRVTAVLALLAGLAVVVLAFLILADIVGRSLFRFSLQGSDELGGYTLALVGSLGLSYTLLRRSHPRIDLAFRFFPAGLRRVLHVLAYAAISGFAVFMTMHAIGEFSETLRFGTITNTPLQTPLWVPQSLWVTGTAIFAVTALICTAHGVWLLRADPQGIDRWYGPISIDEEVHEYIGETPPTQVAQGKDS